ncbi:MAG: hypothetical protein VCC04_11315, partial [Myxococcota bacterium]
MGFFLPSSGSAFEAMDGRIEAHGYFEMQIRTISQNYSDQWDLTQWYNVFNIELELDLVQDTTAFSTCSRPTCASRRATTASTPTAAGCSTGWMS